MGLGYRDWTNGDVPTGDEFDGYLQRQTVMSFASAAARDSALTGALSAGMIAYLQDTATWTAYDGSAWFVLSSPWVTYTPSTTNITLGAGGVISASYQRRRDMVDVYGKLTLGSGGSFGTGPTVSLAVAAAATGAIEVFGTAFANIGATPTTGMCFVASAAGVVQFRLPGAPTATTPGTWASGSTLHWSLTYRSV